MVNKFYRMQNEKKQKNCAACGFIFLNNGNFCPECGAKRARENTQIKKEKQRNKIIMSLIISLCIFTGIAIYYIFTAIIKPADKYKNAMDLVNKQQYLAAISIFNELDDYKDSKEQLAKNQLLLAKDQLAVLKQASVGDIVTFGTYNQDDNIDNGNELIEWQVLAKENNKILLLSDKELERRRYDTRTVSTVGETWETSSLRLWLNDQFINSAFSTKQQGVIFKNEVINSNNPEWGTPGGNTTYDKVFLLSIAEVEQYFPSLDQRSSESTDYAKNNPDGIGFSTMHWWLRSPGKNKDYASIVYADTGGIGYFEECQISAPNGVRPAIWIDLNANI